MQDKEIKILSSSLKLLFHNVYEKIKNRKITDRSLDIEVLKELKKTNVVNKNLEIKFSYPTDEIYNAEQEERLMIYYVMGK